MAATSIGIFIATLIYLIYCVDCGLRGPTNYSLTVRTLACKKSKSKTIPDPNNCHKFWECSGSKMIYYRCNYPGLFSTRSNSCKYYKRVQCGSRSKKDFMKTLACKKSKSKTIPDPNNCRKYWECSGSKMLYYHCNYPGLFSTRSNSCKNYKHVQCGSRSKKDFMRTLACKKSKSKTIPDPNNCRKYWECSGSKMLYYHCNYPGLFSTRSNSCKNYKHVQCGSRSKKEFNFNNSVRTLACKKSKSKTIPDPNNCRKYWECSGSKMLYYHCNYPGLFSTRSNSCIYYKGVQCGSRSKKEFNFNNSVKTLACKKSKSKTIPDPNNCRRFWRCSGSKMIYYHCNYPGLFSTRSNSCKYYKRVQCGSRSKKDFNLLDYCKTRKSKTYTNTKYCHKYYDCNKGSVITTQMCRYPTLYSTQTNSCEDFKKVKCGSRKEYKTKCQYKDQYRLTCQGCIPCEITHPDCEGYPDGVNINKMKGNPYYVVCDQGRTIGHGVFGRCTQNVNKRYSNGQCRNYIWCYYGREYKYTCPAGTVFDEKRGSCQHAYDTCKPCGTLNC